MTPRTAISLALMVLGTAATAEPPQLLGGVAAGTYAERESAEIHDFTLINHPAQVDHPHEIVVGPLPLRAMVQCALYDSTGTAKASAHDFQRCVPIRLFFVEHVPNATARCVASTVARATRPSTGGVVVNRLISVSP